MHFTPNFVIATKKLCHLPLRLKTHCKDVVISIKDAQHFFAWPELLNFTITTAQITVSRVEFTSCSLSTTLSLSPCFNHFLPNIRSLDVWLNICTRVCVCYMTKYIICLLFAVVSPAWPGCSVVWASWQYFLRLYGCRSLLSLGTFLAFYRPPHLTLSGMARFLVLSRTFNCRYREDNDEHTNAYAQAHVHYLPYHKSTLLTANQQPRKKKKHSQRLFHSNRKKKNHSLTL